MRGHWPDSAARATLKVNMPQRITNPNDPKSMSMFIAIVVRNAMEDFHVKHLTDAQMRELNPIIRSAVFTALHAAGSMDRSKTARAWVDFQSMYIPAYWEEPELLEGYVTACGAGARTSTTTLPQGRA